MKRLALVAISALALAGCAATPAADEEFAGVTVLASTNVYGNITNVIGGELVAVDSIITRPDQDPHSYEASARDQLLVSEADLVILNGGGYDPFMEQLIDGTGTAAPILNAVEISGLLEDDHPDEGDDHSEDEGEHAEEQGDAHSDEEGEVHSDEEGEEHSEDDGHGHAEGFNEHVWYSFPAMQNLATEIAHELGELDPDNAETFEANAEAFNTKLDGLEVRAEALHERIEGEGVAITEPVPGYLLAAVGLNNLTPDDFTEAIEEGADVPPLALQETLDLITSGSVVALAYNEQTTSPETERVLEAADVAELTVLSFTETLPDGQDYFTWMDRYNLGQIEAALG